MKLILIRHGESARNRGYEVSDEENNLTTNGVKQAVKLGEQLREQQIKTIYVSSTPRCIQTLNEILRNRDDEIVVHCTKLLAPKMKSEHYEKLKTRVGLFLDDLKYDHKENETVVVVSHQLVIAMILLQLTGDTRKLENGEMMEIKLKTE